MNVPHEVHYEMPDLKKIRARFYESAAGRAPVREWLLELSDADRKSIGEDIKLVEFGWPVGLPVCRPMAGRNGMWEVRLNISNGRIARVLFCIENGEMVLLHGFIKKTKTTPKPDLDLAETRKGNL